MGTNWMPFALFGTDHGGDVERMCAESQGEAAIQRGARSVESDSMQSFERDAADKGAGDFSSASVQNPNRSASSLRASVKEGTCVDSSGAGEFQASMALLVL